MTRPALLAAILLAGCINDDRTLYEVTLGGNVAIGGAVSDPGEVHLELHHAHTGSGELRTPLGKIDDTTIDKLGRAEWTTLVPLGEGEGLVLYGWLDRDGDGLLCAPGAMPEPAGAIELSGFPGHALDFSLDLTTDCAGPSAVYPP